MTHKLKAGPSQTLSSEDTEQSDESSGEEFVLRRSPRKKKRVRLNFASHPINQPTSQPDLNWIIRCQVPSALLGLSYTWAATS